MSPDSLRKLLAPLKRSISMMVARGLIQLIEDGGTRQSVQVQLLADEIAPDVERFQDYGLTSNPHPGAEAIFLAVVGSRTQGVVIRVEDRQYRLAGLASGEVALYDDLGQTVWLKRDGIYIDTPGKVIATAQGDVTVSAGGTAEVTAPHCNLLSDDVNLGGPGGKPIARHDDLVVAGKIVASSTKVKSL